MRCLLRNRLINREPGFQSPAAALLTRVLAALLLASLILFPQPARAQQSCGEPACAGIIELLLLGNFDGDCSYAAGTQYGECLGGTVTGGTIGGMVCGVADCATEYAAALCGCPPPTEPVQPVPPARTAPAPGGGPKGCGDPVDAGTGIFTYEHTDLELSDVMPIKLGRSYRELDGSSRAFGIGMALNYDLEIVTDPSGNYSYVDLVLSDGAQVHYPRINGGNDFASAIYQHTSSPTIYFGSTISFNGYSWVLTRKDGTTMLFATEAMLTSITDRNGNTVQIQRPNGFWSPSNNATATLIKSPNGRWISLTYDSNGRIDSAQDNTGRTAWYVYNSSGHLSKVYDANGGTTTYAYDSAGRMVSFTTPNGNVHANNQYDSNNRVVQQTQPDGGIFHFSYTLDSKGNVTTTDFTDPKTYAKNPNVISCQMTFNSNGYLTSDTWAPGKPEQEETTYDRDGALNLIDSSTDTLGRTTAYGYDSLANITSVTRLSGTSQAATTSFTYGQDSQLASVRDPLGYTWTLMLDGNGNATKLTDPLGDQLGAGYNGSGQVSSLTDGAGDIIQFFYTNGVLSSVVDGMGNTYNIASDAAGRVTGFVDPLGNGTSYNYDLLDDLSQIVKANGAITSFTYDADRNLTSVTDANGAKTAYGYDSMDRRSSRTDPLGAAESYLYDGNSNLTQHTDRSGNVTVYHYDAVNRRRFSGFGYNGSGYESTVRYTWDLGNRLTQVVDSIAGTIARTYDLLNNLTDEQTQQGEVSYTFDAASRRQTMQVVGQPQIVYGWDDANRLTGITQGSASVGIGYDNANRRTCLTLPNGVIASYGYDNDSRVTSLTYGTGGSCSSPPSNLGNLTYGYDADGRVTSKGGTLATTGLPGSVSGNTFNADNEMTAFNGTPLSYDASGNLLNDGTNTYAWDARNHLTGISGVANASFIYDGFGRRMGKSIGGNVTQFLYDRFNPVQELDGSNAPTANLLSGLKIDEYFQRTDSAGARDYLTDILGSTLALTDSNGTSQTSYTYDPFGIMTISGAPSANSFQFTGRENDGAGLHFYRARYYSPTFQRFIAQDPIGFSGGDPNLYGYVFEDPVSYFDPFGLWAFSGGGYIPVVGPFGPGLQVTVGVNPNGEPFLNFQIGVGAGAGYSLNPGGTSPGYNEICNKHTALLNAGAYGEGNLNLGPISGGRGGEAGVYFDPLGNSGVIPYADEGPQFSVGDDPTEPLRAVGGDIGVGFQFGVYM